MSFAYSFLLKLLYPTSVCLILLLGAAAFQKRKVASRICFWLAVAVLLVCGNGWVIGALARHLEWQNLPPNPVPQADCILILSGGLQSRIPPRPTIEVGEAGDRVLYARYGGSDEQPMSPPVTPSRHSPRPRQVSNWRNSPPMLPGLISK